jgi:hypothetical protein
MSPKRSSETVSALLSSAPAIVPDTADTTDTTEVAPSGAPDPQPRAPRRPAAARQRSESGSSTTIRAPTAAAADTSDLPMPTPRHSEIRVQFNTKLRPVVIERTRGFAEHYRASIQEIVETALTEYLDRRGWTEKPQQ